MKDELHQNVPAILLADVCRWRDVPVVIYVWRPHDPENSLVFTYVATQAIRISALIDWIRRQVTILNEYELWHNHQRVQFQDTVSFGPGDVLTLKLFPPNRVRNWTTTCDDDQDISFRSSSSDIPPQEQPELRVEQLDVGTLTLLQLNAVKTTMLWTKEPTRGLPPHGNPDGQPGDDKRPAITPFGRRTIRLHELLSIPQQEGANACVTAHWSKDNMRCIEWDPKEDLRTDWRSLQSLPESTSQWCEKAPWINLYDWEPEHSQELEIFSDGSFRDGLATWSFVVVSLHCLLVYFRRACSGQLRALYSSPTFGLHSPNPPGADIFS